MIEITSRRNANASSGRKVWVHFLNKILVKSHLLVPDKFDLSLRSRAKKRRSRFAEFSVVARDITNSGHRFSSSGTSEATPHGRRMDLQLSQTCFDYYDRLQGSSLKINPSAQIVKPRVSCSSSAGNAPSSSGDPSSFEPAFD